jgi:hypothetical protein
MVAHSKILLDMAKPRLTSEVLEQMVPLDINQFTYPVHTEAGTKSKLSLAAVSSWLLMQSFQPVGVGAYADLDHVLRGHMIGTDPQYEKFAHEYPLPEATSPHYRAFIHDSLENADGLTLLATLPALRVIVYSGCLERVTEKLEGNVCYFATAYDRKPVKILKCTEFKSQGVEL